MIQSFNKIRTITKTVADLASLALHICVAADSSTQPESAPMSPSETTSSKRGALRFSGYEMRISYRTDYEDGTAQLLNISTSGCALCQVSTELDAGDTLLLNLPQGDDARQLQIRAEVVRVEATYFGVQFLRADDQIRQQLIRFFAAENRRRKAAGPPA